jgi:hypothetical protein
MIVKFKEEPFKNEKNASQKSYLGKLPKTSPGGGPSISQPSAAKY